MARLRVAGIPLTGQRRSLLQRTAAPLDWGSIMNLYQRIGLSADGSTISEDRPLRYINLKLAALGCPTVETQNQEEFQELAGAILAHHMEGGPVTDSRLCPVDQRIQDFLAAYLGGDAKDIRLPARTFVLDRHGLARAISLPPDRDDFSSNIINSYRVRQGVLHNPKSDRRTTQGIFHVTEGGLPVPDDKMGVPKRTFAEMLRRALNPPAELLRLPFTYGQSEQAECFVTLLLRPVVCPAVPGFISEKTMEVRFFAPGNLVSNLDFVESIFGNAGDPHLAENDAALDSEHWTGNTGCVILAPHLINVTKKDAGLPHYDQATERQRRDGMCWKTEKELYNNGGAFKITCRDARGVIVTIIADNYFGYCKKEVKTQLSYAANLFGLAEEEHAGGALVFPSYDLGEEFSGFLHVRKMEHSYAEMVSLYGEVMDIKPEGYAIDRNHPDIYYVQENVHFDLQKQRVSWQYEGKERSIKMLADVTYVRPSGYKVNMEKPPGGRAWRLVGTVAEATVCHKPCTVSGGGKSEISKPISDAIIQGPAFVADFQRDFDEVAKLIEKDYEDRFPETYERVDDSRPVLSAKRSLGSVIKLLTPSSEYTDKYNAWLESVPQYIKELVFVVKRFYKPDWGNHWREHFSVDIINGMPGNELKCDGRKLVSNYLRVGYADDGSWRTFGLRKDFHPAAKIALEDDITASVTVPRRVMFKNAGSDVSSIKFVRNCEYRLFQRPDDAIHRGYDKQTESDFAKTGNFFSNYEPLPAAQAREMVDDAITFDQFTAPMQQMICDVARERKPAYFVSNAHPRIVDGKPTKNPRYLQIRPDLIAPRESYLGEMSARLFRRLPLNQPVYTPVTAVLPGRRNNPPDAAAGIRPLAVYNPIHYMEAPELFMEYICSMTGKSPSTTGAGSEGALTKGPFNALPPIYDLNNALVSYLITGHEAFITAAGYVGPDARVDHDVSLLVPEIWARLSPRERDPHAMIHERFLEKCEDFDYQGRKILHSRLGYRITQKFVNAYFGRIFNHPHIVFTEGMLKPELQSMEVFVDGIDNIIATQQRVAQHYFNDGSIEMACPPLRALLHIMKENQYQGKDLNHPSIRQLFTRDYLVHSDWYRQRLATKQQFDVRLWERHVRDLESFLNRESHDGETSRVQLKDRLEEAKANLRRVQSPDYLKQLEGTIGAQPL